MSLEAFGDEGDCGPEGYVTEERAEEIFIGGLQAMREMLARFVEVDSRIDRSINAAELESKFGKRPWPA